MSLFQMYGYVKFASDAGLQIFTHKLFAIGNY